MASIRGKIGRGSWEFRLYQNKVQELDQPGGIVYKRMDTLADKVAELAKEYAPKGKTKALSESIKVTFENNRGRGGSRWYIVADVPYAAAVGKGSQAHPIFAKDGGVLKFPAKGGTIVYTQSVQHPGTKPNDFMQRAMTDAIR